jgi:hypothetical protein
MPPRLLSCWVVTEDRSGNGLLVTTEKSASNEDISILCLDQSAFNTCLKIQKQVSGCKYTTTVFAGYTELSVDTFQAP